MYPTTTRMMSVLCGILLCSFFTQLSWAAVEVTGWDGLTFTSKIVQGAHQKLLTLTVPAGHRYVSVVIDDATGRRVRNLISMGDVRDFCGDPEVAGPQTITVTWDGLNDRGETVPYGAYTVRGVSVPRVTTPYEYAWYNPGTPPYQGYLSSGWGADHSGPVAIAAAPATATSPARAVITWNVSEAQHDVVCLGPNGRKLWGWRRYAGDFSGPASVAMDEASIYLGDDTLLIQLDPTTSRRQPFPCAGAPTELAFESAIAPHGITVGTQVMAVLLAKDDQHPQQRLLRWDKNALIDPRTQAESLPLTGQCTAIAMAPGDQLYAVVDGRVCRLDSNHTFTPVALNGMQTAGPLAIDAAGNLYVMDLGPDYQVKVYTPHGRLIRTVGRRGGQRVQVVSNARVIARTTRDQRIEYQAFRNDVSAMAVDGRGHLWVTEANHPRRVSEWDRSGRLVRDYLGNSAYGGCAMTLHEQDPTLAYAYGMLVRIDPSHPNTYRPFRYASVAQPEPTGHASRVKETPNGPFFPRATLFRSTASGRAHEYLMLVDNGAPVLYLQRRGAYQPVAALFRGASIIEKPNAVGISEDGHPRLWSDRNGDALIQPDELQTLPTAEGHGYLFEGWTYPIQPDLAFYGFGVELTPLRFKADGTPIYAVSHARRLQEGRVITRVGNHLFGNSEQDWFRTSDHLFTDLDGNIVATYPSSGTCVNPALYLPVRGRGKCGGEMFITGIARLNASIGSVIELQAYNGMRYLFTEDGIFLYQLFADHRTNPSGLPATVKPGDDFSQLSMFRTNEAFGGWFGRQADGQLRTQLGGGTEGIVCRVTGLDAATRIPPATIDFTSADVITRSTTVETTATTSPAFRARKIADGEAAPRIDGHLDEWPAEACTPITLGDAAVGSVAMAFDWTHLYLAFTVRDRSPLRNAAQDLTALFRTGDAVELQLGSVAAGRATVEPGDVRLVMAQVNGTPVAMRYRPIEPGAPAVTRVVYRSPIGRTVIDAVDRIEVELAFQPTPDGYTGEARIPFSALGINPIGGVTDITFGGDLGILFSDDGGQSTVTRAYLFNRTPMLADAAQEAKVLPATWGEIRFQRSW